MTPAVRPRLRSRIQGIRGHGADSHLRRGTGLVRVRTCCCGATQHVTENLNPPDSLLH
jgi:hypothetical protein